MHDRHADHDALPTILAEALAALALPPEAGDRLTVTGTGSLPSCFPVTALATASIGAAGLAVSELLGLSGRARAVTVDRHLASAWFGTSVRPCGWTLPAAWDPIAGDYRAADGWIRLHTNAPRHRAAALAVLDCPGEREAVAAAVARAAAEDLEGAILRAGGCAAAMRGPDDWEGLDQGRAVRAEPLVAVAEWPVQHRSSWRPDPARPLAGIRVLDLTRILAGPVATRVLAGLGADVLRIDPPGWDEPSLAPDVTLGKVCTRLDLRQVDDRRHFETLLAEADILVHGYRPDALERLGYGAARRRALNPDLIDVALCAYGWTGPWAGRRGFDSLVQMATGIAAAGQRWKQADRPVPLPVQALDHATGYLMAAAAVRGPDRPAARRARRHRAALSGPDRAPAHGPSRQRAGARLRRISGRGLRPGDRGHGVGTCPPTARARADRRRAAAVGSPGLRSRHDGGRTSQTFRQRALVRLESRSGEQKAL
ncbi:CoA transferase [Methylobacterium oryzae CBMB20]